MSNFASGNVTVFPAVNRSDEYVRQSRIISETLLTGLVNKLVDKDKFVINHSSSVDGGYIEFNIDGYYFRITNINGSLNGLTNLYAKLNFKVNSNTLDGDDSGEYKGVVFTGSLNDEDESEYLWLLTKDGDTWKVPTESFYRYNADHIEGYVVAIDGGEIK